MKKIVAMFMVCCVIFTNINIFAINDTSHNDCESTICNEEQHTHSSQEKEDTTVNEEETNSTTTASPIPSPTAAPLAEPTPANRVVNCVKNGKPCI